jgi:threonine dehydratase
MPACLACVLVSVGGGGLIAGIAAWWAGSRAVSRRWSRPASPTLHAALRREAGAPVDVEQRPHPVAGH